MNWLWSLLRSIRRNPESHGTRARWNCVSISQFIASVGGRAEQFKISVRLNDSLSPNSFCSSFLKFRFGSKTDAWRTSVNAKHSPGPTPPFTPIRISPLRCFRPLPHRLPCHTDTLQIPCFHRCQWCRRKCNNRPPSLHTRTAIDMLNIRFHRVAVRTPCRWHHTHIKFHKICHTIQPIRCWIRKGTHLWAYQKYKRHQVNWWKVPHRLNRRCHWARCRWRPAKWIVRSKRLARIMAYWWRHQRTTIIITNISITFTFRRITSRRPSWSQKNRNCSNRINRKNENEQRVCWRTLRLGQWLKRDTSNSYFSRRREWKISEILSVNSHF